MTTKVDLVMAHLEKHGAVRVKMAAESGVRSLTITKLAHGFLSVAQHPGSFMIRVKPFEARNLLEINRMYVESWS